MEISEIKAKIKKIIEKKNKEYKNNNLFWPGAFWSAWCENFSYIVDLPEDYIKKHLRFHTHHVDGDLPAYYMFYEKHKEQHEKQWNELTKKATHVLSAPNIAGEMGYKIGNSIVNGGTISSQQTINTLALGGVIEALMTSNEINVLEVGSGYGSMCYYLHSVIKKGKYFLVDLPEVLAFSAFYLSLALPDKKMYIYDERNFKEQLNDKFEKFDIVMLPNFILPLLEPTKIKFDLALNIESFQEMTKKQVSYYITFISNHLKENGALFSRNEDRHPGNPDDSEVSDQLKERFVTKEHNWAESRSLSMKRITERLLDISPRKIINKIILRKTPQIVPSKQYICRRK